MLFIDEASQMRLPEAAFAINALHHDRGRLVIVGDHWQLAPIILEKYPTVSSITDSRVYDSFLVYMRNLIATEIATEIAAERLHGSSSSTNSWQHSIFMQLNENHRMNAELAWYTENILKYDGYTLCSERGCTCRYSPDHDRITRPPYLAYNATEESSACNENFRSTLMKILDPKAPLCMVGIKWSGVKGDELTSEMGRKRQA